jgi:hypothetical protein
MLVPVVLGDLDPGAVEDLVLLCVRYHRLRAGTPDPAGLPAGHGTQDRPDATDYLGIQDRPDSAGLPSGLTGRAARQAQQAVAADALVGLEQQILATILQVVSGPGGVASLLRRSLLGKGLTGPSLPLDVGQP